MDNPGTRQRWIEAEDTDPIVTPDFRQGARKM